MAFASIGQLFQFQIRTSDTQFAPTYAAARSAGQLFFCTIAIDNIALSAGGAITNTINVPVCSAGNTYIKLHEYTIGNSDAAGVTVATFYSLSTASVTTTNTLTFSFSVNRIPKCIVGWAYSYDTTKTLLFPAQDTAATSLPIYSAALNTTAPIQVLNALSGDLMIRVCGIEALPPTFAQSAAWTSMGSIGTSGGGSGLNISIAAEFRIANATTNFSSEPSFGTADRVDYSFIIREQASARRRYISIR
jgi:hypothetical protein